jgi:uncharacterized surface protein with fasciclin (FAS1) repeats
MKTLFYNLLILATAISCQTSSTEQTTTTASSPSVTNAGQSGVTDDESQKDVVKIAVGSKDHTTLVTALKAAQLVDALSNAGPFTVFAPTNAAFEKLPKGTVEGLLKPENKDKLKEILEHHVMTSALATDFFQDRQTMGMVNGTNVTFKVKDGATYIDDAKIIGSARASNGWVHIVDSVVLPK